jgi:hypothetical protein
LLEENKVEYVIVGGYAVAFHGYQLYRMYSIDYKQKKSGRPQDLVDAEKLEKRTL